MTKYVVGTALFVLLATGSAFADGIKFDFNALANNANSAAVTAYMNPLLGVGQSVVVTGATASNNYDGEGHVVGPNGIPVTLGTGDGGVEHGGANDTFLTTFNSTYIQMLFTGLTVSSVTFDFEIFPDVTCGVGNCSAFPDFTFRSSTNGFVTSTLHHTAFGAFPVDPNDWSPLSTSEKYAQLAPQTVSFVLPAGVTGLRFIDWPPTIGIDNLCINSTNNCAVTTSTSSSSTPSTATPSGVAPEPTILTLLGASVMAVVRRRSKQRA